MMMKEASEEEEDAKKWLWFFFLCYDIAFSTGTDNLVEGPTM